MKVWRPSTAGLDPFVPLDVQLARRIWAIRTVDPRDLPALLGLPSADPRLDSGKFELLNGTPADEMSRVPICPHLQLIEWAAGFVGIATLTGATRLCGTIEWQEDVTPRGDVLYFKAILRDRSTPQQACLAIAAALRRSLMMVVELSGNRSEIDQMLVDRTAESLGSEAMQRLAEFKARVEAAERLLQRARVAESRQGQEGQSRLRGLGEEEVARWVAAMVYQPLVSQAVGEDNLLCERAPEKVTTVDDRGLLRGIAHPSWTIEGLD